MTTHPPLAPVQTVIRLLLRSGLQPTLGGSGLLLVHGLVPAVRDWDVLVDASVAEVHRALADAGLPWVDAADRSGIYATAARLLITLDDGEIDLMVNFAIWPEDVARSESPVSIPSLHAGLWNGMPLGSLEAWLVAYRLMRRPSKPDRIHQYLVSAGVTTRTWNACCWNHCRMRFDGNWRNSALVGTSARQCELVSGSASSSGRAIG